VNKLPHYLGGHKGRTHVDTGILTYARDELNCKSFLDIGCGPGGQVYEAHSLGFDARGVDGDFTLKWDNPELFELHDFTKGKFNIKTNVDMIWCCEFIEHVEKQYEDNWMSLMKSGKYVFVTYSEPGKPGHHHVNCEEEPYWLDLFERYGFIFRKDLTDISKQKSTMTREFWKDRGLVFERNNDTV